MLGHTPPPVSQGWSVRWLGRGLGLFVLALGMFRTRSLSPARRTFDVAISFLISTAILTVVFWQVSAFYGDRFNLWTNLAYLRLGLPDVFILMLVGTLPDYIQGILKVFLWRKA